MSYGQLNRGANPVVKTLQIDTLGAFLPSDVAGVNAVNDAGSLKGVKRAVVLQMRQVGTGLVGIKRREFVTRRKALDRRRCVTKRSVRIGRLLYPLRKPMPLAMV